MPITPYHLGPGVLAKSLLGCWFSLLLFAWTQVAIDLETAFWLFRRQWPVHRFLHTWLGASVVLVVAILVGKPMCELVRKMWRVVILNRNDADDNHRISWTAAGVGGAVGVYSHILLDSLMHADMRPFAPFADHNRLLGAVTLHELHRGCVVSGIVGVVVLSGIYLGQRLRCEHGV